METKSQVKEEWRDIPGYEGRYQVSDLGRVRSIRTIKGKKVRYVLKPYCKLHYKNKAYKNLKYEDYNFVHLQKKGKAKTLRVHALVWEAFKGKKPKGFVLDHINEMKHDNRLSNLQLLTDIENRLKASRLNPGKCHKYIYKIAIKCTSFSFESTSISEIANHVGLRRKNLQDRLSHNSEINYNGVTISRRPISAKYDDK